MREEILKSVIDIIVKETEIEEDINGDSDLFDDLELSSLEIFTIFSLFEEKFGKKFSEKEISTIVTVNDIVDLIENKGINKKDAKNEAIRVLRSVGLDPDVADLSPAELSGGMQKRVGLARAIISKPEIIFFDEPTTGLDPIMADVINDLIVESVKGLGATALTITHDMASVRKIADRVAMLYKGEIIWQGTVKEMDETENPYVVQFINGNSQGPIKTGV